MGTKRSVLTDEKGLPLAVVLSGANTHDTKLLEETLDHIVVLRPKTDENHLQNLCLDAGYTGVLKRYRNMVIRPISDPVARKRKNWSTIQNFTPAVGLLKLRTLFLIAFENFWFVLKRSPPIIWPSFNLPALLLSGVKFYTSTVNSGIGSNPPLCCKCP